jgi:hypothetical protein
MSNLVGGKRRKVSSKKSSKKVRRQRGAGVKEVGQCMTGNVRYPKMDGNCAAWLVMPKNIETDEIAPLDKVVTFSQGDTIDQVMAKLNAAQCSAILKPDRTYKIVPDGTAGSEKISCKKALDMAGGAKKRKASSKKTSKKQRKH